MQTLLCLTLFCLLVAVHGKRISIEEQRSGCVSCITTVNMLKDRFTEMDCNEVYTNVKKLCDQNGNLSSICNDIDCDTFKSCYSHAKDLNSTRVCYVLEECVDEVVDAALEIINGRPPRFDHPCDRCIDVFKMIPDRVIQDRMKDALKLGCEDPDNYKSRCEKNIDRYFPLVYDTFFNNGPHYVRNLCTFSRYCLPWPGYPSTSAQSGDSKGDCANTCANPCANQSNRPIPK